MSHNVWIPLFVGLAIQITTIPLGLAVPETRGLKAAEHRSNEEEEAEEEPKKPSRLQEILKFLRTDINVTLLVSTFFVTIIGRQTLEILLQYVSKRYGWSLAKVRLSILG
jgi:sugar phosphate permease